MVERLEALGDGRSPETCLFPQVILPAAPPGMSQLPLPNSELVMAVRLLRPNRPTPVSMSKFRQSLKSGEKPAVQHDGRQANKANGVGIQSFL
jgi:hypothetical protein